MVPSVVSQLLAQASTGSDLTFAKIAAGIATLLIGNAALDKYRILVRTRRLKAALLHDCLETLNKLSQEPFEYHRQSSEDEHDWECIKKQVRGFVVYSPLDEAKELVTLLSKEREARLVLRFYERWARFVAYESQHSQLHDRLVEILASCCTKSDEANALRRMKEECWEQLRGTLVEMRHTASELCGLSVALFRTFTFPSECKLSVLSEGRWITWLDFEKEAKGYPAFRDVATRRGGC